jgi:Chitobiase/beta-hexosaminidase C-terminal domain/Domain of unknown function (DUF5122) beta-propeller
MTVAILSTVTAMAVYTATTVRSSSENVKLVRDVAVLNKALRQYEVFGGSLTGVTDPQLVINKMKTRLTGDNKKQMAGLRGSVVDTRLRIELQSVAEAATTEQRARYRTDTRQFEIVDSGSEGIKRFLIDESLAATDFGTETRETALKLARTEKWVWDFTDSAAARQTPGTPPGTAAETPQPAPAIPSLLPLNPPGYSVASGTYPLLNFPLSVNITNPNPIGTAVLHYNVDGGAWQQFLRPVTFDPGAIVSAYAEPLDPDAYETSAPALRDYRAIPETPGLRLVFADVNVTYQDLGGPMLPSSAPGAPLEGRLRLSNRAAIPDAYENSTVFSPRWTLDGSDPLTSGTAVVSAAFTGGYPGNQIPVALADWVPASNTLTVRAAMKTLNPEILNDSAVEQIILQRNPTRLRRPNIDFTSRDCTLTLDVASGGVPADTRIYYTWDGTDPGDSSGEPVRGFLYTGPFLLEGSLGQVVRIRARAYPPLAFKPWFETSNMAQSDYRLPASVDVYVGGEFQQNVTGMLRNIARLSGTGTVDPRFNTGSGASANSIVGVIRQSGPGVLAGGDFDSVNGVNQAGLVRLLRNGAVDPAFNANLSGSTVVTGPPIIGIGP